MLTWLAALLGSSLTFALADVICDVCIEEKTEESATFTEDGTDDEGGEIKGSQSNKGSRGQSDDSNSEFSDAPDMRDLIRRREATPQYQKVSLHTPLTAVGTSELSPREPGLTGEQDAAIAGIVTIMGLFVTVAYWFVTGPPGGWSAESRLKWSPFTHLQFWFAMLGGAMAFMHYFFLLKAFEGAPSTVLLPLVQVASVSVLLGSSVIAVLRKEQWITPTHASAYLLMFIGGILPASGGHLSVLLQRSFWRQSFVFCAIAAELALGLHDLMLSGCAYSSPEKQQQQQRQHSLEGQADPLSSMLEASDPGPAESFEFFVWSRCSFVATFVGMYALSPKLNAQLRDLFSGRISHKFIGLSAISEGLTILGFYLASIAYGLFYQAGIVHAAEASSSQLLNLLLACVLFKCFGIGRASAVGSMPAKAASFVLVTMGLFLCTLEDGGRSAGRPESASASNDGASTQGGMF